MKNEPLTLRHRIGLEIARKLNNDLLKEHPLKQLFWECTLRCNLHCRHCGSDCKKMAGHPDMPKEDFLKVLDSVAASTDPHKVFVIITGGEPLMREDLEECGKAIYDKGFPWGMVTNGLYMTRERFRRLLASGLHTENRPSWGCYTPALPNRRCRQQSRYFGQEPGRPSISKRNKTLFPQGRQ